MVAPAKLMDGTGAQRPISKHRVQNRIARAKSDGKFGTPFAQSCGSVLSLLFLLDPLANGVAGFLAGAEVGGLGLEPDVDGQLLALAAQLPQSLQRIPDD